MNKISDTHPSKILRYCPHCGKEGFHFDGKKFTCKNCDFEFFINEAAAVCGIIELSDGKIILTRRKNEPQAGKLDLPGGFVDIMESAENALIREIREELDLEVVSLKPLVTFPNEYVFKGLSYFTCDIAFVCRVKDYNSLKPADDVTEALIVDVHEIDFSTIGFPSIVNVLKMYRSSVNK